MSDAFTDVAKMKKIKEDIKAHEGQIVEMTLENGRKRQKSKQGRLIEVYPSLFIVNIPMKAVSQGKFPIPMWSLILILTF